MLDDCQCLLKVLPKVHFRVNFISVEMQAAHTDRVQLIVMNKHHFVMLVHVQDSTRDTVIHLRDYTVRDYY